VLSVAFDTSISEGVFAYANGCLVDSGFDVETAVFLLLAIDAPAQPGDVLPTGSPRRGFWGDAFSDSGRPLGSRLWLLEGRVCDQSAAQDAITYAMEATKRIVDDGFIRAIEFSTEVGDEAILLLPLVTKKDGSVQSLSPFKAR
jgi:phage gp46-like protein